MKGTELLILQACTRVEGDEYGFVLDADLARHTQIPITDVRDYLESLEQSGFISLVRLEHPDGLKASVEAKGRTELSKRRSFQDLRTIEDARGAATKPPRRQGSVLERDTVARLDGFSFQRTLGPNLYLATEQRSGRLLEILAIEESRFTFEEEALHRKFMSDAFLACRIDHPYILKVVSVIETNQIVHLVREHCGVSHLRDVIISPRDSLSLSDRRDLLVKIAEGLYYAHAQQLVHGNLTPFDIMIDVEGNPKIAFPNSQVIGTPTYTAPEVLRSLDYDGRADIWSFGIIMFEILTGGKRPFRSNAFWQPLVGEPIPLRQIDKTLPGELERICSRCLSKEVGDRYSTASDLTEELRQCRLNRPSLWRWFRPNRGVWL